ncbi:MAG: hypothetical protein IPH82_19805 [Chloroflexi bacterium]|nr:hypothetical protein [Chloroflexota bacterium]
MTAQYQQENRQQTAHRQLTRFAAQGGYLDQADSRYEKALGVAERRLARHKQTYGHQAEVDQLQARFRQLHADNAANPNPIRATFRLDGVTSHENLYRLIEMGYDT